MGPSERKARENNSGLILVVIVRIGESQGGYLVKCHFEGTLLLDYPHDRKTERSIVSMAKAKRRQEPRISQKKKK